MNRKKKANSNLRGFLISSILSYFTVCLDDLYPKKMSFRISFIFSLLGAVWILASDKLLHSLSMNKQLVSVISMVRSWLYVLVTAAILYVKKVQGID